MSFLGKEYIYDSSEGIDAFLQTIGKTLPEEVKELKVKIEATEDEDKYTLYITSHNGVQETVFENGVEFDDEVEGHPCKTTTNVDGDTVTSKRQFEIGTFIITSEYVDDQMIVTLTIEGLDDISTVVTFKEV